MFHHSTFTKHYNILNIRLDAIWISKKKMDEIWISEGEKGSLFGAVTCAAHCNMQHYY